MAQKGMFDVDISGAKEIQEAFKKYGTRILTAPETQGAVVKSGIEISNEAKKILNDKIYNAPFRGYRRTGLLRSRTLGDAKSRVDGNNIVTSVRSRTKYAKYIEFGTSRMKARPFLRPATDRKRKDTLNTINKGLFKFLANNASKV